MRRTIKARGENPHGTNYRPFIFRTDTSIICVVVTIFGVACADHGGHRDCGGVFARSLCSRVRPPPPLEPPRSLLLL